MTMDEYDPKIEELDESEYELYEGEPDFDRSQTDDEGRQDDA